MFGSTFGHSVTQNLPVLAVQDLNPPNNFDSVFNLAQGPPPPVFPAVPANGRFPLPNGVFARALPETQNLSHVDAYNFTVQRELSPTVSAEIAYVGNRGEGFFGDNPAANANAADASWASAPLVPARPAPALFAAASAGRRASTSSPTPGKSRYNALQAKLTKRWSNGFSLLTHYTLQSHKNNDRDYFFIDPDLNYGPANFIRKHVYVLAGSAELPFGKGGAT